MLEHPRSSPPIACPTRSKTEEHRCWLGRGTPSHSGAKNEIIIIVVIIIIISTYSERTQTELVAQPVLKARKKVQLTVDRGTRLHRPQCKTTPLSLASDPRSSDPLPARPASELSQAASTDPHAGRRSPAAATQKRTHTGWRKNSKPQSINQTVLYCAQKLTRELANTVCRT